MANYEIRLKARAKKVPLWKLADELGICEMTLSRWLRHELPPEKRERILEAIDKLAK